MSKICKVHSEYAGKHTPTTECLQCWKVWLHYHEGTVDSDALLSIIELLEREVALAHAAAERNASSDNRYSYLTQ